MASSGSGNRSSGNKRGSGNRRPTPARSSGASTQSAHQRARDRLSQQGTGQRRRPQQTRAAARRPQPAGRSTGRIAGIFGGTLVVLIAVVIILVSTLSGPGKNDDPYIAPFPITASIKKAVENVPNKELGAAVTAPSSVVSAPGKEGSGASLIPLKGASPLVQDAKPEIVFFGSEYCPYCAATRWPLVIAMSKFGTFSGLEETASSPLDYAPNTHTLDFAKATYSSPYFSFSATEQLSNHCHAAEVIKDPDGNDPPDYPPYLCNNEDYYVVNLGSKSVLALVAKWDTDKIFPTADGTSGGIPFIDFGGSWAESGALYSPTSLYLSSWSQIVKSFSVPTEGIGQAVLGTADRYIGVMCEMAHNKPPICKASFVKTEEKQLKT